MDSISYASLPRVNAEDVSYVAVADSLADISANIDLMNDSISMNAARSIANADRIEIISTQTMCAHENSHHYAVPHTRLMIDRSVLLYSYCFIYICLNLYACVSCSRLMSNDADPPETPETPELLSLCPL